MKILTNLILIITFILLFISCNKKGTESSVNSEKTASFKVQMVSTNIPSEVFRIEGKLLRDGFDSLVTDFVIEEDFATADFGEIFAGEWLLSVTAFAEDNNMIYFGETMVNIQSNQNNVVNLHLDPVTGTLNVIVTWGNTQEDDLVAYYPFNGNANDESDFNNHGTVYGASLTYDRFENENSAYYFDGTDDYITIPHSESLSLDGYTESYTIALWVKSEYPQHSRILHKWDEHVVTSYPFAFRTNSNDGCHFLIYDTNIGQKVHMGNIWDNQWHLITAVVNNQTDLISVFVDSELIESEENPVTTSTNNSIPIYIGRAPILDNRYYHGAIDDIYIYNYALNITQIQEIFQMNK